MKAKRALIAKLVKIKSKHSTAERCNWCRAE